MFKKTFWRDYHNGNVDIKSTPRGLYISESCGRSRMQTYCPFCKGDITLFAWNPVKRCDVCGAIISGSISFRVKDFLEVKNNVVKSNDGV